MKPPQDCSAMTRKMLMQANARMDMSGMRVLFPATEEINTRITRLFSDRLPSLDHPEEPALVQAFRSARLVFHTQLGQWRDRKCALPDVFRLYFETVLGEVAVCAQAHDIYINESGVLWSLPHHGPLMNHYASLDLVKKPLPESRPDAGSVVMYADSVLTRADKNALRYGGDQDDG